MSLSGRLVMDKVWFLIVTRAHRCDTYQRRASGAGDQHRSILLYVLWPGIGSCGASNEQTLSKNLRRIFGCTSFISPSIRCPDTHGVNFPMNVSVP